MTTTGPEPDNSPDLPDKPENLPRDYHVQLPEIGQRIGSNRIIDLIAEGGMAAVYKVWHEDLEIVRAIKILKPGFDEESKQRIRTEAKISAHLRHPNIVEIYGVQFWNDTVPYLEMEFVDGYSLKTILEKHKQLPLAAALSLIYFVCNALHYAHNQVFTLYGKTYEGIVHRDVKPANILITQNGVPKLADFGIARPQDISLHTEGQKVLGTFTYLSPEQLEGDPLDRRSDIYSLGAVLYECITGTKAFPQRSLTDLIREKLRNGYPSFESLKLDLPKRCEQIIDKSMQLSRDKRFATAEELGVELLEVFRKTSADTPEQVLALFCSGGETRAKRGGKPRRGISPVILFPALIAALAFVASMVLTHGFRFDNNRASPVAPPPAAQETTIVNAPAPAAAQPAPAVSVPPPAQQHVDTMVKFPRAADPLAAAAIAVRAQRWQEAVGLLEKMNASPLPDSARRDVEMLLLESYLGAHDLTNANILAQHAGVDDGYFFLLAGETNLRLGRLPQAIDEFCKAQTTPSRYRKDLRKDATFLWAKALFEVYRAKPNSDNKRAALRAWQQFTNAFCAEADHTGRCSEAENGTRELTE